jgi:Winged helix DNA-binding domain
MTKPLTHRDLNRATLARQMLLERSDRGIAEAVAFLGGLQAQQTHDPYIGLWSRLVGFRHEDLTALIVDKTLNRATSMRGTLHLHTADDLLGIRSLVSPFLQQQWKSNFLRRFGGHDPKKVLAAGRKLLDKSPMRAGDLNKALLEKFPGGEAIALSTLLQLHEVLIQIPPTRIWGNNSAPILTRVENWLPAPHQRPMSRVDLVRRYIRAFGPVTVADMATWSRLNRLGPEFEAIRDELTTFEDVDGRTLYDFADAPRPDGDTPAPVRFLPLYDNVYLGYDNRRRMLSPATAHLINVFENFKPAVLIDGTINAGWTITVKKGAAVLEIEAYRRLLKREIKELEREGLAFLKFMQGEAKSYDLRITAMPA